MNAAVFLSARVRPREATQAGSQNRNRCACSLVTQPPRVLPPLGIVDSRRCDGRSDHHIRLDQFSCGQQATLCLADLQPHGEHLAGWIARPVAVVPEIHDSQTELGVLGCQGPATQHMNFSDGIVVQDQCRICVPTRPVAPASRTLRRPVAGLDVVASPFLALASISRSP